MSSWATPPLSSLQECIADPTLPIGMRMRAAYFLRHLYDQSPDDRELILSTLGSGMKDRRHGSLMRHEFAYVLGQLRDERACSDLEEVLMDDADCVMVRHETAEALGAIGANRSSSVLTEIMERYPDRPELSETCRLALNVMEWRESGASGGGGDNESEEAPVACACMLNPYSSVDPAPAHPSHVNKTPGELGTILRDHTLPMFERYRAMFSLRNLGGEENVAELCKTLATDTSSALLRHEVAYVLGQLQHSSSVEALEISLRRADEHEMVRHESAEALGAIEGRWEDVERILTEFSSDANVVVRESCLVALDAADYWGHNNQGHEAEDTNAAESEEKVEVDTPEGHITVQVNFAQAKAASTIVSKQEPPNRVLVNHFNVKI